VPARIWTLYAATDLCELRADRRPSLAGITVSTLHLSRLVGSVDMESDALDMAQTLACPAWTVKLDSVDDVDADEACGEGAARPLGAWCGRVGAARPRNASLHFEDGALVGKALVLFEKRVLLRCFDVVDDIKQHTLIQDCADVCERGPCRSSAPYCVVDIVHHYVWLVLVVCARFDSERAYVS